MDKHLRLRRWFGLSRYWDKLCAWTEETLQQWRRWHAEPWPPRCLPALEMLETRWLPSGNITDYSVTTLSSSPINLTLGPDGNIWFTENSVAKIGKITTSGTVTEYSLNASRAKPYDITAGPDGNLWFTENSTGGLSQTLYVGKSTTGGSITDYSMALSAVGGGNAYITSGPGGLLYPAIDGVFNKIGEMTTAGSFSSYNASGFSTYDIAAGPDGNVWFVEGDATDTINRMTPSGTFTAWNIPTNDPGPVRIALGPDGNLWFTEAGANKIGRITSDGNGTFTEWTIPTSSSSPQGITAGPDGAMWFVESATDKLGRLALDGTFTEWSLTSGAAPNDIVVGGDGKLWFTEPGINKIGNSAWLAADKTRSDDPADGLLVPYGPVAVSPQTGNLQARVPLDFEQGVHGSGDGWSAVLGLPTLQPALVYTSSSTNVKPLVEVTLLSDPQGSVPTSIDATLTWNNGSPQSPVNFSTSGHSAGDVYDVEIGRASCRERV
jgi:streptogramin lyase